ncbi:hypothetical protein ACWGB8_34445 [Kitasatospora sp. NPDC054939]
MSDSHDDAPAAVSTPEAVRTRLGTLHFRDDIPDTATSEKVFDNLDLMHGVDAYLAGPPGVSVNALRRGFLEAGIADNSVLFYSGLMDRESLFRWVTDSACPAPTAAPAVAT